MRDVNELVNEALVRWAAAVGVKPREPDEEWHTWSENDGILEELNASRSLDLTGLTTLMLIRGATEAHLKTKKISTYDLLLDPAACEAELAPLRALRDLVEAPANVEPIEAFLAQLREAAAHYAFADAAGFETLLADKWRTGLLRRDALKSIDTLEAHQFAFGAPAAEPLQYNREIFEFWNVNSLLRAMSTQLAPGITMCLVRDPEQALASYFVWAIRNGETLTVLTDREEGPHPAYSRMSRRPDRALERRAALHWFPYALLDLGAVVDEDGRTKRLFAKERKALVPYQAETAPLKQLGQLEADEFVWAILMIDLIRERYGTENRQLPAASYTGEMVVNPHALVPASSALVKAGQYRPLEAPPLTLADVSPEATSAQWERPPIGHLAWIEEAFGADIDEAFLNPVGQSMLPQLAKLAKKQGLLTRDLDGWHDDRSLKLEAFSPITFGTAERLEHDRRWAARVNKLRVVQARAEQDYEQRHEEVARWYRTRLEANWHFLLTAAAIGKCMLPSWKNRRAADDPWKNAFSIQAANLLTQGVGGRLNRALRRGVVRGIRLDGGPVNRWRYAGGDRCFVHTDVRATVFTHFEVNCPEAIALLTNTPVAELPLGLRNHYEGDPYTGNHILDRLDPIDWVLSDPWKRFETDVILASCKACIHTRRKELGLPPIRLQPEAKNHAED